MDYYVPDDVTDFGLTSSYLEDESLRAANALKLVDVNQLDGLYSRLRVNRCLRVYGRPGMGKTTVIPKSLAVNLEKRVVIVQPTEQKAISACRSYIADRDSQLGSIRLKATCIFDDDQEFLDNSLIWMTADSLVSWLYCRRNCLNYYRLLSDVIVVVDQAEQLNEVLPALDGAVPNAGAVNYISITSTRFGLNVNGRSNVLLRSVVRYDGFLTPEHWDVDALNQPWSAKSSRRSLVIFIRSDETRRILGEQYRRRGYAARVLDCFSDHRDYIEAQSLLCESSGKVVVLADSDFRYSLKFFSRSIVDAGDVDLCDSEDDCTTDNVFQEPNIGVDGFDMFRTAIRPAQQVTAQPNLEDWFCARDFSESGDFLQEKIATCGKVADVSPTSIKARLSLTNPETDVKFADNSFNGVFQVTYNNKDLVTPEQLLSECECFDDSRLPPELHQAWSNSMLDLRVSRYNLLGTEILAIRDVIYEFVSAINSPRYKSVTLPNIVRLPNLFKLLNDYAIERDKLSRILMKSDWIRFRPHLSLCQHSTIARRRQIIRDRFRFPISADKDVYKASLYKNHRVFALLINLFAFNQGFSPGAQQLHRMRSRDRFECFWKLYLKALE